MHVTTIAAVFILQDGEWVAMKQDTESSWIFLRLKTVKTSEEVIKLMLIVSAEKKFAPASLFLETQIISITKWILVSEDFAEFSVDNQRYGVYFEHEEAASTFTGLIAEGLNEVHNGIFTAESNMERFIERVSGAVKETPQSEATTSPKLSNEKEVVTKTKPSRRRSLAKFADVNEAVINASRVVVNETFDMRELAGKFDDLSSNSKTSSTDEGEINFDKAIENQITTVCKRNCSFTSPVMERRGTPQKSNSPPEKAQRSPAQKKNSLTKFTSIFRRSQSHTSHDSDSEGRDSPTLPDRKLLGCLPRFYGEHEDEVEAEMNISAPADVLHMTSVHFNEELGRYEGLPEEWKAQNTVFGVSLRSVPKREVAGYNEPIPTVLILLKEHLIRLDAASVVGIFRLAPDKDECNNVKDLINLGDYDFNECTDPNILANLFKVFFRELPQNLFNTIPEKEILKIAALTSIEDIVTEMTTGVLSKESHSLILWLLDFMALFVQNELVNKMSAKNMAIVISPNLYAVNSENPMVALTMAQKVAEFTTKILVGRLKIKFDYDAGL